MDPLTRFLDGPRATGAFALAMHMSAPWGVRVDDRAALTIVAATRGRARVDDMLLTAGDVALIRGPEPYSVTDDNGSNPSIAISPGQHCTTLDGRDLQDEFRHGVRRWGNTSEGETSLLVGTYERPDEAGGLVARAHPRLVVVPRDQTDSALIALLEREIANDDPASQVVIDRLLDVLVVSTIRSWASNADGPQTPTWLTCKDPLIKRALECLHAEPATPWTVEILAQKVNTSRASLAARFHSDVGEPPMTYLTRWRLTLAGDLLHSHDTTIADVARSVGYNNAYAFSTAFKRQVGVTPSEFRRHRPALSPNH